MRRAIACGGGGDKEVRNGTCSQGGGGGLEKLTSTILFI